MPAAVAVRSIIRAKPACVNGEPRLMTKMKGGAELSRWSRRKACISSGETLGLERPGLRGRLSSPPRRQFIFSCIHGISWADVEAQPTFIEAWDHFVPF
jgi:hypothetical protein